MLLIGNLDGMPKISLEQWQVFHAIVEEGSFAKAALRLHKSQSSISYAIAKLQERIGFDLFVLEGRKATLTDTGKRILNDSRQLIQSANQLEKIATHFNADLESALSLAIDEIFPSELLYKVLGIFGKENTYTRIHLQHGILSGPSDLLQSGKADIAIVSKVPEGFLGHKLLNSESRPYANVG